MIFDVFHFYFNNISVTWPLPSWYLCLDVVCDNVIKLLKLGDNDCKRLVLLKRIYKKTFQYNINNSDWNIFNLVHKKRGGGGSEFKWDLHSPTVQVARGSNPVILSILLPNQDLQETWTCKTNLKTKIWSLSFNFLQICHQFLQYFIVK